MLLIPFFSAAILLRAVSWQELVALLAATTAMVIKDPLVVIARQRFVWKTPHPETGPCVRAVLVESMILAAAGLALLFTREPLPFLVLFAGAGLFTVLAVSVNVKNRQRSEWFQVLSAVALSSTAAAACLAVRDSIPRWCWWLWALCALQATTGIFVVHARLDARIAARKPAAASTGSRRAAFSCICILAIAGVACACAGRMILTTALLLAAASYLFDLRRQRDPGSLQMSLKSVGLQALTLAIVYALLVTAGLWNF